METCSKKKQTAYLAIPLLEDPRTVPLRKPLHLPDEIKESAPALQQADLGYFWVAKKYMTTATSEIDSVPDPRNCRTVCTTATAQHMLNLQIFGNSNPL